MKRLKSQLNEVQATYERTEQKNAQIKSSKDACEIIREVFPVQLDHREAMICLYLNRANNTCGFTTISIGGVSGTLCDPKMVFQHALLCNASAFILCHNHPSGSLEASETDKKLTKKLLYGAKYLDITLLDHLIITTDGFYSFADEGEL